MDKTRIVCDASHLSSVVVAGVVNQPSPPKRIQRKRTKGWRLPPNTVVVTRPRHLGNPFRIGGWYRRGDVGQRGPFRFIYTASCIGEQPGYTEIKTATEAVEWYRWYRSVSPLREHELNELSGKDVACWCALDQPCHGDVLLELAGALKERK